MCASYAAEEGDTLEVTDKGSFDEEVNNPDEFKHKGIPTKLIVRKLDVEESPTGMSLHKVEQVFENVESTEHNYNDRVLRDLLDIGLLEKQD